MHRNHEATTRDHSEVPSNTQFDNFVGSFGLLGKGMHPSIFGEKDPFFTRPFRSAVDPNTCYSSNYVPHTKKSKGPVIKQLGSDDEEISDVDEDGNSSSWANKNPLVEFPEDQASEHENEESETMKEVHYANARNVSFQRVTYGGIDGAYYTKTTSRRTGNDGATVEEHKEADRTTGQATHRISRGMHDKGHSVMRKLGSDGKVDTMQALHNLREDELPGFEQSWSRSSAGGWDDTNFMRNTGTTDNAPGSISPWASFFDPFSKQRSNDYHVEAHRSSSARTPKKVVRINID